MPRRAARGSSASCPCTPPPGLSLGEFTAHAAAGTFDFETGLRLVAKRGLFMQEACEANQGAMAAMIGGDESAVRALAAECDVDVANLNSPGQIVISGETREGRRSPSRMAKEHGIRLAKMLNVAGAYHSRLMNSAFLKLGEELADHADRARRASPSSATSTRVPCATPRRSASRSRIR